MKETELYQPVKNLFEGMGYKVNSEVEKIDVTAVKDNLITVIELKTSLNMKLLIQASKRQRLTHLVYVAIPKPDWKTMYKSDWKDKLYLLRRLELGLIYVSINGKNSIAEIVFEPKDFDRTKSMASGKKKRKALEKEIDNRHGDYNTGGSNKKKIITSYKENVIYIASLLEKNGEMSTSELRKAGSGDKVISILNNNFYGWFERVSRGRYILSKKGKTELNKYREIVDKLGL